MEIPTSVQVRMLLRSLAVQGSWNYETLIGAGFAFTMLPALRLLYGPSGPRLDEATARHAELFNSHPYFGTVAVGAVSRMEADHTDPAVIDRFKIALRGPLGAMGDRLFWTTWRPMTLLAALTLFLMGAAWWIAVAVFLIAYNALHLTVRIAGLRMGLASGLAVARELREAPLQRIIDFGTQAASLLIGVGIVAVTASVPINIWVVLTAGAAVALGLSLGFRTRRVMIAVLAITAVTALIIGLIGHGI